METDNMKIYNYIEEPDLYDKSAPPFSVNYKNGLTVRLQAKATLAQGEVNLVEYFASATPGVAGPTYTDLIIKEVITYVRDTAGNAISQTKVIHWIQEDETPNTQTKTMLKIYSPADSIREGIRRRGNVITELKGGTVYLLMATEIPQGKTQTEVMQMGTAFLSTFAAHIQTFIDASGQSLYNDVLNDTSFTWLNNVIDGNGTTIRQWFLNELNIWGL